MSRILPSLTRAELRREIEAGLGPINIAAYQYRVVIRPDNQAVHVTACYDQGARTHTDVWCGFMVPGGDPSLADVLAVRLCDAIHNA